MRDYSKLPLLTPEEAYERAAELGGEGCPLFGPDYRVRNLESWKAVETLLRQDDVSQVIVASFGLRRFSDSLDAINMLRRRGWQTRQINIEVQLDGRRAEVMALKAVYIGL